MNIIGNISLAGLAYQQYPFLSKTIQRQIGDLIPHVVIRESHADELEITDHPIQLGAAITDHAYKKPSELTIECGWSDSPPSKNLLESVKTIAGSLSNIGSVLTGAAPSQSRAMYDLLLKLQASRTLLAVTTGKRMYQNMLIKSLSVATEPDTENVLMVTAVLREVFIVSTQTATISVNSGNHANPSQTTPKTNNGAKSLTTGAGFVK